MCDRCADLDYRLADIWRPCYVPGKPVRPPIRLDHGEDYFEGEKVVSILRAKLRKAEQTNRRLVAELEALRSRAPTLPAPQVFDAVIVHD